MNDEDPDRSSFEDVARAVADEVSRMVERLQDIDVDEIARTANAEAERVRGIRLSIELSPGRSNSGATSPPMSGK